MMIMNKRIHRRDLLQMTSVVFDDEMVKGVVDVERRLLAIDAELHADLEEFLLEQGSAQEDLWGINLYPDEEDEDLIEFDSLINIRPRQNNRSRGVEDEETREQIKLVVYEWIE